MSDETEGGVHRLLDMVVEEVSLVDRAANQRRFLVVKRDDMAKKTETEKAEGTEEGRDLSGALQAAVDALESLSAIVELLGSGEAADDSRLATLASELRQVAEQISTEEPAEVDEIEGGETEAEETPGPAAAEKASLLPGSKPTRRRKSRRAGKKRSLVGRGRKQERPRKVNRALRRSLPPSRPRASARKSLRRRQRRSTRRSRSLPSRSAS